MSSTMTNDLQALVTGGVIGALMKQDGILIEVEPVTDEHGFTNEVRVTGRESGTKLVIRVETPEERASVEAMRTIVAALAIYGEDANFEALIEKARALNQTRET